MKRTFHSFVSVTVRHAPLAAWPFIREGGEEEEEEEGLSSSVLHLTVLRSPHTIQSTNKQALTVRLAAAAGVTACQYTIFLLFIILFWTHRWIEKMRGGDGAGFITGTGT